MLPADPQNPPASVAPIAMIVAAIEDVAVGCRAITLRPAEEVILPATEAGAHIGVHLPNGMLRQYSLLEADPAPDHYRIGVKRDPASRGGSAYIFDHLQAGDHVQVDAPRNNFPLDDEAAHSILIAGGIGITPIMAMIGTLEASGRAWTLHYAARARDEAAFAAELSSYPQVHLHFDAEQAGVVLPIAEIVAAAPNGAHFYCCGPTPMLAAFERATDMIAPERVHVEYFVARHEAATEGQFLVELARSGLEVMVLPGQSILEAIREAGVEVVSSCEEGVCGACETRVLAGVPDHRDAILSERERAANRTMFICCSGCSSDRLVLDR